jgi:hypothetical protein
MPEIGTLRLVSEPVAPKDVGTSGEIVACRVVFAPSLHDARETLNAWNLANTPPTGYEYFG